MLGPEPNGNDSSGGAEPPNTIPVIEEDQGVPRNNGDEAGGLSGQEDQPSTPSAGSSTKE